MNLICGWYLNFLQYARLVFNYLSGNIHNDCSDMSNEQPAAARSCIRQAAVFFMKLTPAALLSSLPSGFDSRCCYLAYPGERRSSCWPEHP